MCTPARAAIGLSLLSLTGVIVWFNLPANRASHHAFFSAIGLSSAAVWIGLFINCSPAARGRVGYRYWHNLPILIFFIPFLIWPDSSRPDPVLVWSLPSASPARE